jgi:hypothetical protein
MHGKRSDEFKDARYVDNLRNYMAGAKAPHGDDFGNRIMGKQRNIAGPTVTSAVPLDADPHRAKVGPEAVQSRWNDIRGRR